ncbi:MAG: S1C family serine protease [Solirubrobacteraceae bacterium]
MRRAATLLAVLGVLVAGCGGSKSTSARTTTTKVDVVKGAGTQHGGFDPEAIYEREAPGVVTIFSVNGGGLGGIRSGGLGSGFILDGQGEIVTNAHVVTEGKNDAIHEVGQVYVDFADGNRVPARIVGFDPDADVALLKIDPAGLELHPLPLGNSDRVKVGQPVAAMGSPFGEKQSLSVGVVSAVDRDVESLTNFQISGASQTDAASNPGNSCGPLVDGGGRVLGLNQQIQSQSGGGEGVGFAVPIDLAKRSVTQLREQGRVDYAYLGVSTTPLYPQLAEHFNLPVQRGAWVQVVTPGGPAEGAGLRGGKPGSEAFQAQPVRTGGDVIVKVGPHDIMGANDLSEAVARLNPGQTVPVVVFRGSTRKTIQVKLAKRPEASSVTGG